MGQAPIEPRTTVTQKCETPTLHQRGKCRCRLSPWRKAIGSGGDLIRTLCGPGAPYNGDDRQRAYLFRPATTATRGRDALYYWRCNRYAVNPDVPPPDRPPTSMAISPRHVTRAL